MKANNRQKLVLLVAELGALQARVEDLHCQCDVCKECRATGEGDLCFQGRKVMQIVYALDVANSVSVNIVEARSWKAFGPQNQTMTVGYQECGFCHQNMNVGPRCGNCGAL